MFALHETTQRRLCRILFLSVCVLPTVLTLAGVAYRNRPWRHEDWQRTLAQRLHVRVALGAIKSPRPGTTVLKNLRLADLRTDQTLASLGTLSFQRKNARLALHVDHLEIQAGQLPAFAISVATWLATSELAPLDFSADQLTISSPSLQTVHFEKLRIGSDTGDPKQQRFRLTACNDAGAAVRLALEKKPDSVHCLLDTRQAPLPAWLLGKLVPGVGGCGEAKFSGVITAENGSEHVCGEMKGEFGQVDLQAWIGTASPHRLQAVARVQLDALTWTDTRIELARGSIEAEAGACSYSLLLSARDLCHCATGPAWETLSRATHDQQVPFDQLALGFQLNSTGLLVIGQSDAGALLTFRQAPLLFGPPSETGFPVGHFVQLFDYRHQPGWLPATRRAHEMAGKLPLPGDEDRVTEPRRK